MYKILVVDDTPVIQEFLKEVLNDDGFEVDIAADGATGYNMAMANDYVVIICDVHMPIMNGPDMVKKIMLAKPNAAIIMTDSLPGKMAEKATAVGAIGCLAKPFALDELRTTISRVISARNSEVT
jgi:DNA-binding NtrC family response regulator